MDLFAIVPDNRTCKSQVFNTGRRFDKLRAAVGAPGDESYIHCDSKRGNYLQIRGRRFRVIPRLEPYAGSAVGVSGLAKGPRLKPPESLPCFMGLKAHAPSVSGYRIAGDALAELARG